MLEFFVPVLILVGFGFGVHFTLTRVFHAQLRVTEAITSSVTIGTFFLVVPMLLVGTLFQGGLQKVVLSFAIVGGFFALVAIYQGSKTLLDALERIESTIQTTKAELVYLLIIILLLLDYMLYQFALPLRGWDALNVYFPDALIFYTTDKIPVANPLTLYPVYKEPLTSLLYTYVLFLTKRPAFAMIPALFFIVLLATTYDLALEILGSQRKALLATCVTWILPLTQTVFLEYAYYQDPAVATFFSVAIYHTMKATKTESGAAHHTLVATAALSLTLLAKLDGWILLLILPLLISTGYKGKITKAVLLFVVMLFFGLNAATTIFVSNAVVILATGILCVAIVTKQPHQRARMRPFVFIMIAGLTIGSYWFLRLSSDVPQVWEALIDTYLSPQKELLWHYPSSEFPLIAELIHMITHPDGLFLFFGVGTAIFWVMYKMVGFWEGFKNHEALLLWILPFSMIVFSSYYMKEPLRVFFRYLSPIIVPLALIITIGVCESYKRITGNEEGSLTFELSSLFLGFIFLAAGDGYTPVFVKQVLIVSNLYVFHSFPHLSLYYQDIIYLIPWTIAIITISVSLIFTIRLIHETSGKASSTSFQNVLWSGLILLVVSMPVLGTFDETVTFIKEINAYRAEPDKRDVGIKNLAVFVEKSNIDDGFLVYDTPGLAFMTLRRVLDLGPYPYSPLTHIFDDEKNMSWGLEVLEDLGINHVVVNQPQSRQYSCFVEVCYPSVYFFRAVDNSQYFAKVYDDEYYTIFKIKSFKPFLGILDIFLGSEGGSKPLHSILGALKGETCFDDDPEFNILLDFSTFSFDFFSYNLTIALHSFETNTTENIFYRGDVDKFGSYPLVTVSPFSKGSYILETLNLTVALWQSNFEDSTILDYYLRGNVSISGASDAVWHLSKGDGLQYG